ncbi:RNA methyltransferase [Hydrotalea sp.]|uniref:TrmH family RNA methyltransferase n=1 Tax=Hydrotalea sp. TaxID=2881279 RepID=UPI0026211BD7|nr:RNA methyltransferase [Hydrotalea sp.]
MLSRNEVKYIQSLCHKKQRNEDGVFIAEGTKIAGEILASDYTIKKIYATESWLAQHSPTKAPVITVSKAELARIGQLQTSNEVLLLVQQPAEKPVSAHPKGWVLVLDGIQDPGNLGTMIRIADWFGISHIICSTDTVEWYNPKVIQSTMGSFLRVNHWYTALPQWLQQVEVPVTGAVLNGVAVQQMQKLKQAILIIGNEGNGIRPEVLTHITHPVTIPGKGRAESLNAAVAAGILLSHLT